MTDTLSIALQGLQTQGQRLARSADRIANLTADPTVDLAAEAVNILQTKVAYKADVAVIKAEKEMQDRLLDTIV